MNEVTGNSMNEVTSDVKKFATELIKTRNIGGGRFGIEDSMCNTNLISKHYSPLTTRKYNIINGWPMFVSMICDEDMSDIDQVVNGVIDACDEVGLIGNNVQNLRNITGILSETILKHYNTKKKNCVEGIYILLICDKVYVCNAFGDMMNHEKCLNEIMGVYNLAPHV